LRPILMTSLAFIFGVLPLTVAVGAGAEMRQSLGTAVFAGMVGVTLFGLLFTPTFYAFVRAVPARATGTWRRVRARYSDDMPKAAQRNVLRAPRG
jgi:Cu/Ag efflux pump CusA